MKILFNEWSCSNITDKQKNDIQANIEKELLSVQDKIKPLPKKLTVSIFEIPRTRSPKRSLECFGVDDNGDELVTYVYPLSGEGSTFRFPDPKD
uniref:Uncharacterized protein n=1 Tax=viral metagenome TaxID=1070528 RepID=A0A6M3JM91_9ZZZZ